MKAKTSWKKDQNCLSENSTEEKRSMSEDKENNNKLEKKDKKRIQNKQTLISRKNPSENKKNREQLQQEHITELENDNNFLRKNNLQLYEKLQSYLTREQTKAALFQKQFDNYQNSQGNIKDDIAQISSKIDKAQNQQIEKSMESITKKENQMKEFNEYELKKKLTEIQTSSNKSVDNMNEQHIKEKDKEEIFETTQRRNNISDSQHSLISMRSMIGKQASDKDSTEEIGDRSVWLFSLFDQKIALNYNLFYHYDQILSMIGLFIFLPQNSYLVEKMLSLEHETFQLTNVIITYIQSMLIGHIFKLIRHHNIVSNVDKYALMKLGCLLFLIDVGEQYGYAKLGFFQGTILNSIQILLTVCFTAFTKNWTQLRSINFRIITIVILITQLVIGFHAYLQTFSVLEWISQFIGFTFLTLIFIIQPIFVFNLSRTIKKYQASTIDLGILLSRYSFFASVVTAMFKNEFVSAVSYWAFNFNAFFYVITSCFCLAVARFIIISMFNNVVPTKLFKITAMRRLLSIIFSIFIFNHRLDNLPLVFLTMILISSLSLLSMRRREKRLTPRLSEEIAAEHKDIVQNEPLSTAPIYEVRSNFPLADSYRASYRTLSGNIRKESLESEVPTIPKNVLLVIPKILTIGLFIWMTSFATYLIIIIITQYIA